MFKMSRAWPKRSGWPRKLLLGLLGLLAAVSVMAEPMYDSASAMHMPKKFVHLAVGDWPPYIDQSLPHQGLLAQIARAALSEQGLQVKWHFMDWNQALAQARAGQIDASLGWSRNAEREKDLLFSDPVSYATLVFFHSEKKAFSWDSMSDLSHLRIAIVEGYNYGERFEHARREGTLKLTVYATEQQAIEALISGKVDLFPSDVQVGKAMLMQAGAGQGFVADEHPLQQLALHLVAKPSASANELMKRFNAGLQSLQSTGRYSRMVKSQALIAELASIRFLTEDNPPLCYQDDHGSLQGVFVRVLREALQNMESDVQLDEAEVLPWARAFRELQGSTKVAVFPVVKTSELTPAIQWVGPIFRSNVVLFARDHESFNGQALPELATQTICAVRDSIGAQVLLAEGHPQPQTYLVPHAQYCARMLKAGRLKFWAHGRDIGRWQLEQAGVDERSIDIIARLRETQRYIAFSQEVPDWVVRAFQQEIDFMRLSGRLQSLIDSSLLEAGLEILP